MAPPAATSILRQRPLRLRTNLAAVRVFGLQRAEGDAV